MFNLNKKETGDLVSSVITSDLQSLNNNDPVAYQESLTRIARSLIKGIIGKTHEYTFEESLFILNEEGHINKGDYDDIKKAFLKLAFLKYSNMTIPDLCAHLDGIKSILIRVIPNLVVKCDNNECLNIYRSNMKNDSKDIEEEKRATSKLYKREILETERSITKSFTNSASATSVTPTQTKLDVPFGDFFLTVTGYPLEKQMNLAFEKDEKQTLIWNLYAKYYILEGKNPKEIYSTFAKYGLSQDDVLEYLENNKKYPSTIKRYIYLQELIEITLQVCLHILMDSSIDEIINDLTGKNYEKEQILFILGNVLLDA
jgi:hypothetical protein